MRKFAILLLFIILPYSLFAADWLVVAGSSAGGSHSSGANDPLPLIGNVPWIEPEDEAEWLARDSYTLSGLYVRVSANTQDNTSTVISRKNGLNGNQTVSITGDTTGAWQDTSNSDSIVSGDTVNTRVSVGGGAGALTVSGVSYKLSTASNNTPFLMCSGSNGTAVGINLTRYILISGSSASVSSLETSAQYTFRVAATLSNFTFYVAANANTGTSTARTRKNTNNGNQSVSIGPSATGTFEDASNTDSIASGDIVCYQLVTANSGGSLTLTTAHLKSTSVGGHVIAGSIGSTTLSSNITRYIIIGGNVQGYSATETDAQVAAQASFTAKNMFVRIGPNTINGATTYKIRKNTDYGNLNVSVPASTGGVYEDTSNTDSFVAADLINWEVKTGGTSGLSHPIYAGFELAQPAATPLLQQVIFINT